MAKTIKEIAEEIGVSKQAVFKKIKREPLSTSLQGLTTTVDGRLMVEVDGEKLIKQAFFEIDRQPKRQPVDGEVDGRLTATVDGEKLIKQDFLKNDRSVGVHTDTHTERSNGAPLEQRENDGIVAVLQTTIDTLQGQLSVKDKQIEELNTRLSEVTSALVAAQQTAQAAQALHAGTIQQQLTSGETEPEVHQQETKEKKGWLSRLFGKSP